MNLSGVQLHIMKKKPCRCHVCRRSRKYRRIVDGLAKEKDREFMVDVLEYLMQVEEDHDLLMIQVHDLKEAMAKKTKK